MTTINTANPIWIVVRWSWKNATICVVDMLGRGGGMTRVSRTKISPNRV
jgi:hypothetical protein